MVGIASEHGVRLRCRSPSAVPRRSTTPWWKARRMLIELGMPQTGPMTLLADSSAARALAARRGVGEIRHMETRMLWLQAEIQHRRVALGRVPGKYNPADLMTKYLPELEVREHLSRVCTEWKNRPKLAGSGRGGRRHKLAPQSFFRHAIDAPSAERAWNPKGIRGRFGSSIPLQLAVTSTW